MKMIYSGQATSPIESSGIMIKPFSLASNKNQYATINPQSSL